MARKAFIHINGVTYQLEADVDSSNDPAFQAIERRIERLAGGSGDQELFDVLIDGHPARLRATTQGVFAASAFVGGRSSVVMMDDL